MSRSIERTTDPERDGRNSETLLGLVAAHVIVQFGGLARVEGSGFCSPDTLYKVDEILPAVKLVRSKSQAHAPGTRSLTLDYSTTMNHIDAKQFYYYYL